MKIDELRTPCYVIDEGKLTENLLILNGVMQRTGARILLAQKAFSAFYEYPLIGRYLSGTTLHMKKWERKTMYSVPLFYRRRWMSW